MEKNRKESGKKGWKGRNGFNSLGAVKWKTMKGINGKE
jgi:hypothetical protein